MGTIKADGRKPKNIKHHNLRYVLSILRTHDACTASEISRESNLSVTTIVKILDRLKQAGIVKSLGKGSSTKEGGKKPELVAFNERFKFVLCVYFSNSSAVCAFTDLNVNTLASREFAYSDKDNMDKCADEACEQLMDMMQTYDLTQKDICGISLGIDGIVDSQSGMVVYPIHNSTWKPGCRIVEIFRECFPDIDNIQIENSGRLNAQRFFWTYPELVSERVLVMYTGASSTSGILLQNGETIHGANCLIGEFGHMSVPNARGVVSCPCGRTNCFEILVSIDRIPEYVKEMIDKSEEGELWQKLLNSEVEPMELIQMADHGSAACCQALDLIVEYYLSMICNLMITCDPEYYVIGGVYASHSYYFRQKLLEKFEENRFWKVSFKTRILYDTSYQRLDCSGMSRPVVNKYLQTVNFDE